MGSRNYNGSYITQINNVVRNHSQSNTIKSLNTSTDSVTASVPSSGIPRTTPLDAVKRFASADMSLVEMTADNSIEWDKFVNSSGNLEHEIVRANGNYTSVSSRSVPSGGSSLGPMVTDTEVKIFSDG